MNAQREKEFDHLPTEEENEHIIHKSEGSMHSWCSICRSEEICLECRGTGSKNGKDCVACETSGRRLL